ncbi:MAG: hypothetical protein ACR5LC_05445 [Symbiopectobacterium sp.]
MPPALWRLSVQQKESGGFSQGVALRQMYDRRLTDAFTSTNQPGATGEALMAASMIGALETQMDWIQLGPWNQPG